eukprot:CAMPEP_0170592854 /NCGR_PEP_ID=MMETSP0224-20130122/13141_1 /TAXON_ID=285029 /ORGANISM="Togula jolla, Strain CCCM 725" /LENGTH=840 /DNA_ID=CAMNT_0010916777 /DNA_START=56 /DNA_END=2578 /DNA_ORIENTATION=+
MPVFLGFLALSLALAARPVVGAHLLHNSGTEDFYYSLRQTLETDSFLELLQMKAEFIRGEVRMRGVQAHLHDEIAGPLYLEHLGSGLCIHSQAPKEGDQLRANIGSCDHEKSNLKTVPSGSKDGSFFVMGHSEASCMTMQATEEASYVVWQALCEGTPGFKAVPTSDGDRSFFLMRQPEGLCMDIQTTQNQTSNESVPVLGTCSPEVSKFRFGRLDTLKLSGQSLLPTELHTVSEPSIEDFLASEVPVENVTEAIQEPINETDAMTEELSDSEEVLQTEASIQEFMDAEKEEVPLTDGPTQEALEAAEEPTRENDAKEEILLSTDSQRMEEKADEMEDIEEFFVGDEQFITDREENLQKGRCMVTLYENGDLTGSSRTLRLGSHALSEPFGSLSVSGKLCVATVYEKPDLSGWEAVFPPGEYSSEAYKNRGAKDGAFIVLETACSMALYTGQNLTGESVAFKTGLYGKKFLRSPVFFVGSTTSLKVYGKGCKGMLHEETNFEGPSVEYPVGTYNIKARNGRVIQSVAVMDETSRCSVIFYRHDYFCGFPISFEEGAYLTKDIIAAGASPEELRSARVLGTGCVATIYGEDLYGGWSVDLPEGAFTFEGFTAKGAHHDLVASIKVRSAHTGAPSEGECKAGMQVLDFSKSELLDNNLGGQGPGTGAEILHYSSVAVVGGVTVDLVVSVLGRYEANNASMNGVVGDFGRVNVLGETSTTLSFSFLDAATEEPVYLDPFYFSLHDVDASHGVEKLTVHGFESYHKRGDNHRMGSDCEHTSFTAVPRRPEVSPESVVDMTEDQWKSSVTFIFGTTSSFDITIDALGGLGGRNILFSGSSLTCFT